MEELQNYINEMREAGYKDSEIRTSLVHAGWPDEYLDNFLDPVYATDNIISIRNFHKYYGSVKAVDGISLKVEKGEIFGFLGPNGAGKTTTIRAMMDFIRPTSGTIKIFGRDSKLDSVELKKHIGYLSGEISLYEKWTGQQHIDFARKFFISQDGDIVNQLVSGLEFNLKRKVKELSSGNKQKLSLILAFMFRPRILILDEPTNALDPLLQNKIYEFMQEFADNGTTIFMSSHNLAEVEKICTRVAIIKEGHIVEISNIKALKQKRFYDIKINFASEVTLENLEFDGVESINILDGEFAIKFKGDINEFLNKAARFKIEDIAVNRASLEDIFLEFYK